MPPIRTVVVLGIALLVLVATGAIATANHGGSPGEVDPQDRSPGAGPVALEFHSVATTGTDGLVGVRFLTHDGVSPEHCSPRDARTFGIDRGNDNSGTEVDDDLIPHVRDSTYGEDYVIVEFDDDAPGLDAGDAIVAEYDECYRTPDEAGWYQLEGHVWGAEHERGEEPEDEPFVAQSHHYWICECDDEAEARTELGPSPSALESEAVAASDRESDGATVVVDDASLPQGGFLAVYDELPDSPGPFALDHRVREALVEAGTWEAAFRGASDHLEGDEREAEIDLDEPLEDDTEVFVVAHRDTNDDGTFDWIDSAGSEDDPFVSHGEVEYSITYSEERDREVLDAALPLVASSATVTVAEETATAAEDDADDDGADGEAEEADGEAGEAEEGAVDAPDDEADGGTEEPAEDDGPGFGAVVALLAVLAGAAVYGRQ